MKTNVAKDLNIPEYNITFKEYNDRTDICVEKNGKQVCICVAIKENNMTELKDYEFKYRMKKLANTLGDWVLGTLLAFFIIGLILFSFGVGYCSVTFISYTLDKTNCNLYVDNKKVYTGRTALVHTSSIGENGNTKSVNITKDKFGLFIQQKYVSNNVRLETINE